MELLKTDKFKQDKLVIISEYETRTSKNYYDLLSFRHYNKIDCSRAIEEEINRLKLYEMEDFSKQKVFLRDPDYAIQNHLNGAEIFYIIRSGFCFYFSILQDRIGIQLEGLRIANPGSARYSDSFLRDLQSLQLSYVGLGRDARDYDDLVAYGYDTKANLYKKVMGILHDLRSKSMEDIRGESFDFGQFPDFQQMAFESGGLTLELWMHDKYNYFVIYGINVQTPSVVDHITEDDEEDDGFDQAFGGNWE